MFDDTITDSMMLRDAMKQITKKQRAVLLLVVMGYKQKQIARMLQISVSGVRILKRRGISHLRVVMG
jgi:RNA polymerase sigma factor (sigma-70 family)